MTLKIVFIKIQRYVLPVLWIRIRTGSGSVLDPDPHSMYLDPQHCVLPVMKVPGGGGLICIFLYLYIWRQRRQRDHDDDTLHIDEGF